MLLTRQQVRRQPASRDRHHHTSLTEAQPRALTSVLKLKLVSEQRQIRRENKQARAKAAASKVRRVTSARKEPGVEMASQRGGEASCRELLPAWRPVRWRGLEASRALHISRTKSC